MARILGALAALGVGASQSLTRPPVARRLVEALYMGRDPFAVPPPPGHSVPDVNITNVRIGDIDCALALAPQPVSFYVEVGSYEGGSAILAAARAARRGGLVATTVLAVDPFLGDFRTLWNSSGRRKEELLRSDGSIALRDRFRANVHRSGHEAAILPLQATSSAALRLLVSWAEKKLAPQPQVIYLDSAHLEGETLLELELAWQALAPGGILFGDDWALVQVMRDVTRFAAARADELDETFARRAEEFVHLARVRRGLYVSYLGLQWFVQKAAGAVARIPVQLGVEAEPPRLECWSSDFIPAFCCAGPRGNPACWDLFFTYEACCAVSGSPEARQNRTRRAGALI